MIFLRLFLLTVLICTCCAVFVRSDTARMLQREMLVKQPVPAPTQELYGRLITCAVKRGDTFLSVLSQHGMAPELATRINKNFMSLGLKTLFPGDSLIIMLTHDGALTSFSLLNKMENWYNVTIDSLGVRAKKDPVQVWLLRSVVHGTLSMSLSEDLFKLGVGDPCVAKFADIFAWDINFFVDPQPGDSFDIIFEKKYAEGKCLGYGDILYARYVNNGHVFNAIGIKNKSQIMKYFDCDGKSVQKEFLKAPLRFNRISSRFSLHRKHPVLGIIRPHLGIDYAAPTGTPVFAAADGKVVFCGVNGGYGKLVRIMHGGAYETYYGHLNAFANKLYTGKRVVQGECIGYVGATGMATGPHLDYRMIRASKFVNPLTVLLPSKSGVSGDDTKLFLDAKSKCLTLMCSRFAATLGCFPLDFARSFCGTEKDSVQNNVCVASTDSVLLATIHDEEEK